MRHPSRFKDHAASRRNGSGRLRRYHSRLKGHRSERSEAGTTVNAASYVIEAPRDETAALGDFTPVIIAEATTALKQLSVSEAVAELDMTGAPVLVFRHAAHGGINVLYRRQDGHLGWIDPAGGTGINAH
jgi:hypothetical protein